jgi:hypothetical protein
MNISSERSLRSREREIETVASGEGFWFTSKQHRRVENVSIVARVFAVRLLPPHCLRSAPVPWETGEAGFAHQGILTRGSDRYLEVKFTTTPDGGII